MKGLDLTLSADKKMVILEIEPLLVDYVIEAKTLLQFIKNSDYSNYCFLDDNIIELSAKLKDAVAHAEMDPIRGTVAEAKDAILEICIAADKMSAELTITSAFMGKTPSIQEVFKILKQHEIIRGISTKRITELLQQANHSEPGLHYSNIVARGLPCRWGKHSRTKIIIESALQRILAPKETDEKVDMRDFGEIYCVNADQILAKRMPPTNGRSGFTVTNKKIPTEPGTWLDIKLGRNAYIDENDNNIVRAKIAGLPQIAASGVGVSDVLVSKGVNVATGHINFDGSIIINGDVTEKMRVVAQGDVTVNGFVESAYIEAGGDVIITQGASGKLQEIDCEIVAQGSAFFQHAQGINVRIKGNLNVGKQLAYSRISCEGEIMVGSPNNPQGKLITSTLNCASSVTAGYIGAISGSKLNIDYTDAYNQVADRYHKINDHFDELVRQNTQHELKVSSINNRKSSPALAEKLALLNKELGLERVFLNWMRINRDECKEKLDNFGKRVLIFANHTLHAGVNVKLNDRTWQSETDHSRCKVVLENKKWKRIPVRGAFVSKSH